MVVNLRFFLIVCGCFVNLVSLNKICLFWLKIRFMVRLLFKFIFGINYFRILVKVIVYNEVYSEYILRVIILMYENFFNVGSKVIMIFILSIFVLCGMECYILSDFYINEFGYDSIVLVVFWLIRFFENFCIVLIFFF